MSKIKASFKGINKNDKNELGSSNCLLTVSVGQQTHEGERLESTIDLINKTFYSCTITLHDSLQRYTMALGGSFDPNDFHDLSVQVGNDWMERNAVYYKNLKNYKIVRWDQWLEDPNYAACRENILKTINEDPTYKVLFDSAIQEFLSRYYRRLSNPSQFNMEKAERCCFEYLVEECAVLYLWKKENFQFELYAGKHNAAMQETRNRFVLTETPDLLRNVTIGFNRRPNLKPQNFSINRKIET